MKVLFAVHSLRRGGAERLVVELANHVARIGHSVHILGLVNENRFEDEIDDRIKCEFFLSPSEYRWRRVIPYLARLFYSRAKEIQADVLHMHSQNVVIIAALSLIRIPSILVVHGYGELDPRRRHSWAHRAIDVVSQRSLKAKVIGVSEGVTDSLRKYYRIRNQECATINNGVDIQHFTYSDRREINVARVVAVGTLSKIKNVDLMLEAYSILLRASPESSLTIVGEGPDRERLERRANEIGGRCIFTGQRTDIGTLLGQANVFWHFSESEGLPLAILEAMATGLPVVGFDVPGVRDVVISGETGTLVQYRDCVGAVAATMELLKSGQCYDALSHAARVRVEDSFTFERMLAEHLHEIEAVTKR